MPLLRTIHECTITIAGGTTCLTIPCFAESFQQTNITFVDVPVEEGLGINKRWRLLFDCQYSVLIQNSTITNITLNGQVLETGPLYVKMLKPYFSGLPTDHLEVYAVGYIEGS